MSKNQADTKQAAPQGNAGQQQMKNLPLTIVAQYVRDLSFENPAAVEILRSNQGLPQMDISIGMDARKIEDDEIQNLYEVVLNVRAEAKHEANTVFIAELQYGTTVIIGAEVEAGNHHPLLLIEVPRIIFPFARQIMSDVTTQGGYPPLMLNPVDFYELYMQRFGKEIEAERQKQKSAIRDSVGDDLKKK
jgi:preprotein translocase subunit SecB